jgi:diguanylate cyclase (GGDEF)-like protein
VGLVLGNFDRFRSVNQVLGATIGDAVLRSASARMAASTAPTDTLARVAGDEFALVVAQRETRDEIVLTAERLREALMRPATVNGGQIETSASFGVAVYPDDAPDAATLHRYADLAVSTCKANGRRAICCYDKDFETAAQRRGEIEAELREAIEDQLLMLEYQPLFDLHSGRITCVEALVRWRHPERGMVSPGEFIPIAEECGLIRPLGHWVLGEACAQKSAWDQRGLDLKVAKRRLEEGRQAAHLARDVPDT